LRISEDEPLDLRRYGDAKRSPPAPARETGVHLSGVHLIGVHPRRAS
jgi:hypothetical protein